MGMIATRPPVADLVMRLYDRAFHPEWFDTLAMRTVRFQDYVLSVRLTATGHAITWNNGTVRLTEVLATTDPGFPEDGLLLRRRLRGERSGELSPGSGLRYSTSAQVEVLPPEVFLNVHDEITADGRKRGLFHHFQPHHRFALSPIGLVTTDARTGCLMFSTFHTFPDEYAVVKTQSLIERA